MGLAQRCQGCRTDKKRCVLVSGNTRCERCIQMEREDCDRKWPDIKHPVDPAVVVNIDSQRHLQQRSANQPTSTQAYPSTDPFEMGNQAGSGMTVGYHRYPRPPTPPAHVDYQGNQNMPRGTMFRYAGVPTMETYHDNPSHTTKYTRHYEYLPPQLGIPNTQGMNWRSDAANLSYGEGLRDSLGLALSFDGANKEVTTPLDGLEYREAFLSSNRNRGRLSHKRHRKPRN